MKPVAVVTGGARRLGRHLCEMLTARRYEVVIIYRASADEAQSLVQAIIDAGGTARALQADIADSAQVQRASQQVENGEDEADDASAPSAEEIAPAP